MYILTDKLTFKDGMQATSKGMKNRRLGSIEPG